MRLLIATALILAILAFTGASIAPRAPFPTPKHFQSPLEAAILAAPLHNLDPHWVIFTAYAESGFRPYLVGAHGELGEFQINMRYFPAAKTEHLRAMQAVELLAVYAKRYQGNWQAARTAYVSPKLARAIYGR